MRVGRACGATAMAVASWLCLPLFANGQECLAEDASAALSAQGLCIAFSLHRNADTGPVASLVAVIHGDLSPNQQFPQGPPADYHQRIAARMAAAIPGVVVVALIRPGYADSEGRQSTGDNYGRRDSYTPRNIDALAEVTRRIADQIAAPRIVLVGHSGGAAIAGVTIGRHPELASAAVLAACPCSIRDWRAAHPGWSPWTRSLSPNDFVPFVPTSTRVVALTGALDANTFPFLGRAYVDSLVARGNVARFVEVPERGHNGVMDDDVLIDTVRGLVAPQ